MSADHLNRKGSFRIPLGERRYRTLTTATPKRARLALDHATNHVWSVWANANRENLESIASFGEEQIAFLDSLAISWEELYSRRKRLNSFAQLHGGGSDLHELMTRRVDFYMKSPLIRRDRVNPQRHSTQLNTLIRTLTRCLAGRTPRSNQDIETLGGQDSNQDIETLGGHDE